MLWLRFSDWADWAGWTHSSTKQPGQVVGSQAAQPAMATEPLGAPLLQGDQQ